jgi:hypothetical protein
VLTDFQVGWVAAFLEGEGSFTAGGANYPCATRRATVKASQLEREVLDRLKLLLGGTIYNQPNGRNSIFVWQVTAQKARSLAAWLRPYMSQRRQGQIDAMLIRCAPQKSWSRLYRYPWETENGQEKARTAQGGKITVAGQDGRETQSEDAVHAQAKA